MRKGRILHFSLFALSVEQIKLDRVRCPSAFTAHCIRSVWQGKMASFCIGSLLDRGSMDGNAMAGL